MKFVAITRRKFLKSTGLACSSTCVYAVIGCSAQTSYSDNSSSPWSYLSLGADHLDLILPRTEMGQDIASSFAIILAEEMAFPLDKIQVSFADADAHLGNQLTVGSASIRLWWDRLRQLGAQIKSHTLQQAANAFKVPVEECISTQGMINHLETKQSIEYLEILRREALPHQIKTPALIDTSKFLIIGKGRPSIFVKPKVTGTFSFLGDYHFENVLTAVTVTYRKSWPVPTKHSLDSLKQQFSLSDIFVMNAETSRYGSRIVLVGDKTWPLLRCKEKLEQTLKHWIAKNRDLAKSEFDSYTAKQNHSIVANKEALSLTFETPLIAHAPMETETAVAEFKSNHCEIWAPTQAPLRAKQRIALAHNIPVHQVTLHTVPLGGGFGRKRYDDYLLETVRISKALFLNNRPSKVKLFWTREDDLSREFYRPATLQNMKWSMNNSNAIQHTLIESQNPGRKSSSSQQNSFTFLDWNFLSKRLRISGHTTIGIWRSVEHGYLAFALCSFVDELSHIHNEDPIEFYKKHIKSLSFIEYIKGEFDPKTRFRPERLIRVVDEVKLKSEWDTKRAEKTGYGFAAYTCFKSYIALVVKVLEYDGQLTIEKIWVSVDCGIIINPNGLKAQIEGGIIFGLSACLYGEIMPNKDAYKLNFDNFRVTRMENTPEIEVYIQSNEGQPTGVGELGVPPIAPAIANAIRNLNTNRFVKMPFIKDSKLNKLNAVKMPR